MLGGLYDAGDIFLYKGSKTAAHLLALGPDKTKPFLNPHPNPSAAFFTSDGKPSVRQHIDDLCLLHSKGLGAADLLRDYEHLGHRSTAEIAEWINQYIVNPEKALAALTRRF